MAITSKERIIAALEHKEADRVPVWETFWGSTIERWKSEGLPDGANMNDFFGLDPTVTTGVDWTAQFPPELIEETDQYVISRNPNGALQKQLKGHDGVPQWWDFQLTDKASWQQFKHRLEWNTTRVNLPDAKTQNEAGKDEYRIYFPACCGFESFKYHMGMEEVLMAFAENPEWVAEMMMTTADYCIDGLEYLLGEGLEFDACFITEDMGFKGRAFFSPRTYREIIMPAQKKLCDAVHAHGMKMLLHSCGNNMQLVPLYIEAGFDALNPLEIKAGMDFFELKKSFGDVLTLWGGIDVRAIADEDPSVMEREIIEKVTFAKQGGGYVFSSDHSIPDNVSMERYQRMVELGKQTGTF